MKLWFKILIALVLGIGTGLILGPKAEYLKPIGTVFLSLINMVIVLLVLSSMTVGITSIHDPQKLGRVGLRTLGLFLVTTLIAILFGLFFAKIANLGNGLGLHLTHQVIPTSPNLNDILLSIIPRNPVESLASGQVLQVIIFSVFLGIAINLSGEKGKPVLHFFESLSEVMYRLTSIIMEFSPIGIFAIMAWVAGSFGIALLLPLLKYILVFYFVCFLHVIVVFCGILRFMAKVGLKPFFKGMRDAILVAFTTCSSSATLAISMHCAKENLGVSKNIASFVLPLGSTINMNGTAIFQTMSAVFVATAYGIELDIYKILTLIFTATLSAVGTAGIPGSGFIMLSAVFSSIGLPLEGLALIAGIDKLREMIGTVLNILGDAVVAVYVAKKEGELDEQRYYQTELVQFKDSEA